jgi:4-amino-4-deoxy-L-arabinose transferase-like glycosyltransferase
VLVTYYLGRVLLNRWTGYLGAFVLLTSSHFLRMARFGMTDAPLVFFLSLALYFFWRGQTRNRYLIFSGIAIGLAVMTKGFAGFFIFPIVWIYCLLAGRLEVLARSSYWIGVAIAAAIALPWHLYEMAVFRAGFMHDVVVRHLWARTTTPLDQHGGNFYFYIRTLVNKYHPWILVGIFSGPLFLYRAVREREEEILFLTVWMFFLLAALTLIRTKLDWYLFPVYPALSLSVGDLVGRWFREDRAFWVRVLFLLILAMQVPFSHVFRQDYSGQIKGIAPLLRQIPQGEAFYLYNFHESPAATFYLDRKSAYLDDPGSFRTAAARGRFMCLVRDEDLGGLRGDLPRLGVETKASFQGLNLLVKG